MIKGLSSKKALQYKIACDGFDLINKFDGQLLNEASRNYALDFTRVPLPEKLEEFSTYCQSYRKERKICPRELSEELCEKYEVGLFNTSTSLDIKTNYVLFNQEILSFWKLQDVDLYDIDFMVAISRNRNGIIDGIGLRILDQTRVEESFKWLFPFGQDCTFGLHLDNGNEMILCEGFQDMIALRECGYNAVGLGSGVITPEHLDKIDQEFIYCGDMDNFGMMYRESNIKHCFFAPKGKDPYDTFLKHGKVNIVKVSD